MGSSAPAGGKCAARWRDRVCLSRAGPAALCVIEFGAAGQAAAIEENRAFRNRITPLPDSTFMTVRAAISRRACIRRRGELEITDINRAYLEAGSLSVEPMGRGMAWLDIGTHESLLDAAQFIATMEKRQGPNVAMPEETAFRMGYIGAAEPESMLGHYSTPVTVNTCCNCWRIRCWNEGASGRRFRGGADRAAGPRAASAFCPG